MNLSFVMNAILNLSLSLFRIVLNLVPERVSSSSLAIHGRRGNGYPGNNDSENGT